MSEINKISNVALDKLIVIAKEIENATKNMNLGNRMPNNLYALQELKERRAADKLLDIKAQLRLVRDKCPDVWKTRAYNQHCPDYFGMPSRKAHDEIGDIDKCVPCKDCDACMNKALEGDE